MTFKREKKDNRKISLIYPYHCTYTSNILSASYNIHLDHCLKYALDDVLPHATCCCIVLRFVLKSMQQENKIVFAYVATETENFETQKLYLAITNFFSV